MFLESWHIVSYSKEQVSQVKKIHTNLSSSLESAFMAGLSHQEPDCATVRERLFYQWKSFVLLIKSCDNEPMLISVHIILSSLMLRKVLKRLPLQFYGEWCVDHPCIHNILEVLIYFSIRSTYCIWFLKIMQL